MTGAITQSGSCLCGAVRFNATSSSNKVGACHCGTCRKWGGGPYMEINCGSEVSFEGEQNISVYSSSDWAERGFCKQCGSHLFYRLKENQQHMIAAGLFDDQGGFVFDNQVFIDKKPSFYSFSNKTNDMTEAELFALFGAS